MRFPTALVALLALVAIALYAPQAEAAKNHRNFVLYNETGDTVVAFYFCPSGSQNWGPNQLEDDPLYDGDWVWNKHNFGQRYYHMRFEFSDGAAYTIENVDLAEVLRVYLRCDGDDCWADYAYE